MGYRFREVKCPLCDHIFMWSEAFREGLLLPPYRLKETKEFVEEAKCPKCGMKMAILEHILEGIDVDDDRLEGTYEERENGFAKN